MTKRLLVRELAIMLLALGGCSLLVTIMHFLAAAAHWEMM